MSLRRLIFLHSPKMKLSWTENDRSPVPTWKNFNNAVDTILAPTLTENHEYVPEANGYLLYLNGAMTVMRKSASERARRM